MQEHITHLLTKVNMQRLLEEEEKSGRNLQQQLCQQLATASAIVSAERPTAHQQVSVESPYSSACSLC